MMKRSRKLVLSGQLLLLSQIVHSSQIRSTFKHDFQDHEDNNLSNKKQFYSLSDLNEMERKEVIHTVNNIQNLSNFIDWEKLRDNYYINYYKDDLPRNHNSSNGDENDTVDHAEKNDQHVENSSVLTLESKGLRRRLSDVNVIVKRRRRRRSKSKPSENMSTGDYEISQNISSSSKGSSNRQSKSSKSFNNPCDSYKSKSTGGKGKGKGKGSQKECIPSVNLSVINSPHPSSTPSSHPTSSPVKKGPTTTPNSDPTKVPTKSPSKSPLKSPSKSPTKGPLKSPSKTPTKGPTVTPTTSAPVVARYEYSQGNCPNPGSTGLACAQDKNLREICDKYHPDGSFRVCWEQCRESFCCIHDANPLTNDYAPSCSTDENCAQYAYCYLVWWKFHDTIGPAVYLRVKQNDDFFDVDDDEAKQPPVLGDDFFQQLYLHHFNDPDLFIDEASSGTGVVDKHEYDNAVWWDYED